MANSQIQICICAKSTPATGAFFALPTLCCSLREGIAIPVLPVIQPDHAAMQDECQEIYFQSIKSPYNLKYLKVNFNLFCIWMQCW